jgi:glycosyltransferase involved in cell wall biosynthesis
MPADTPFLSLVIPAHNEESRLPGTLEQVFAFLEKQEYSAEVVVVENGSMDRTLDIAQGFTGRHPNLNVIHTDERGKGLAVKRGMLEACGTYRFFADADFSMPIDEINRFLPPALPDFDIAIASRETAGAIRYGEPFRRHLSGRVFNALIRLVVLPGLEDTQCGFKCFHAPVVEDIFPRQTMPGWSFDVEVLFIARRKGYRVQEIGVPWYFNPGTKVSLVRDSLRMAVDLFTIQRNARKGLYD